MRVFVFIFLIALALTGFSTPLVRRFSLWIGFVDLPATRKLHREPVPLLGGVAIFGGAIAAFLMMVLILPVNVDAPESVGTLLASAAVALTGLVDDRRPLPAWAKLSGQFLGFVILIYFGVRVRLPIPQVLNYLITFAWLGFITNAINFLDNMDGLSAGVSGVAAAFILLLATMNDQYLVAALAAGILGACLGFLRYNLRPAQIFMGDAGALFLGFLLAVLGIQLRFPGSPNFVTWMVPIFVLGLPIFDTTLVVVSRLRRGVNPLTTAGKDHFSHRLVRLGYSQLEAVLIIYLITVAYGMGGLFITRADVVESYTLGLGVALVSILGIWHLERLNDDR